MSENNTELSKRLVVGHKRDGRSCYDKDAKRELIEACLRPGVSVARMALEHGVNANLLRTWITRYRGQAEAPLVNVGVGPNAVATRPAFIPVVEASAGTAPIGVSVTAELPNGIRVGINQIGADELRSILHALCKLPCSGSTAG